MVREEDAKCDVLSRFNIVQNKHIIVASVLGSVSYNVDFRRTFIKQHLIDRHGIVFELADTELTPE